MNGERRERESTVHWIEVKGERYLVKKEAVHFDFGDLPTPDGKVDNPTLQPETQENCPPLPTHIMSTSSPHNSGRVLVLLSAGSTQHLQDYVRHLPILQE